jgi:hypothetical protein
MRYAGWGAVVFALCACGGAGAPVVVTTGDGGGGSTLPDAGDAGPGDAGPGADCNGIVPSSAGSALAFDVPESIGMSCVFATSDGQGIVAVESHDAGTTPVPNDQVRWFTLEQNGSYQKNSFQAPFALFPQPSGFEGYSSSWVNLWDNGTMKYAPVEQGAAVGPAFDRSGTVAAGATASGITVHRIDALASEVARASASVGGTPWAAAEDRSGAILAVVVQSGGAAKGVWFDLAKGTAGAAFDLGAAAHDAVARPLSSGGIAVRLDGHWVATVQPDATQTSAAPAWLRDGSDFALARGGKAYAVTQNGSSAIEFVSTQGNACGSMTFTGAGNLSVGADGTVIGGTGTGGCTKVFWRGALR